MMIRAFSFAAAMAALVPTTSFAESAGEGTCAVSVTEGACVLDAYPVTEVKPYRVDDSYGKAAVARVRGAEIVVHATPGLTAQWLRHQIEEHIVAMTSMPDCVLDVADVRVQVRPKGHNFIVTVIAPDDATAREVLARARLMVS